MRRIYITLILTFISLFIKTANLAAQETQIGKKNTMISVPVSGASSSGTLSFPNFCNPSVAQGGKVWVKIDMGENYDLGNNNAGHLFNVTVDLDIQLIVPEGSVEPSINFNVSLDNNKPEALVYVDMTQFINADNNLSGFSYQTQNISGVTARINSVNDNQGIINLNDEMRIGLHYELQYGIDASENAVTLTKSELIPGTKVMHFEWENSCLAPNYEFQLLRLYNIDPLKIEDEQKVTVSVDWSKALNFQTYSSDTFLDLTIGEGQGYYLWRVRPIGTKYPNGIGDYRNWGEWNESQINNVEVEIDPLVATTSSELFFFTDIDDQLNYQYSRIFTEGNKVSEQLSYANSLNQVRQSQRYLPSKEGYKLISQTILDNSGRPTLNTLPVPKEGEKLNGYISNFVTTNGELYRANNFDEPENFLDPAVIDATTAFSYYSSLNGDQRIPDAKGYPFTRAIFANDGTDRVKEQSGVGETHMLGEQLEGRGRTTRTLYATPTMDELIALFGDEAPNHQDVSKIISIDPNNTKSVVYITKEGHTIATGLTFSEDSDVLESVKSQDDAVVSGKKDFITNNTTTAEGFKASKRVAILEDNTEVELSYFLELPVLEGLCNNINFEMDYQLQVEIFDANSGLVIQEFNEPSLIAISDTSNENGLAVNFGTVVLNAGSYYIQKTLKPSGDVQTKLSKSGDNVRNLIEPYFAWVSDQLDEVDCEDEMKVFYEDLFFYGKTIYNENLVESLGFPSGITVDFPRKASIEEEDLFMDYYDQHRSEYDITIYYSNDGNIVPIDFSSTSELGDIIPVKVDFTTPCCSFTIPVVFNPPFRVPTKEAVEAYMADPGLVSQVNSGETISPNYNFLTQTNENFNYNQTDEGDVTILNGDAYPFDFEGYALSMLVECQRGITPNMTEEELKDYANNVFYNSEYMRGWHEEGLFNQMVYHMATDYYANEACQSKAIGETSVPSVPIDDYHLCDIPKVPEAIPGAAYAIQDLAKCWEPIVTQMVNEICVEGYDLNTYAKERISPNYDDQNADPSHDEHFNDNIKNFIVRWISKAKLRRKIRKKKIGEGASPEEEASEQGNNLPYLFLNCTGYSFGDILNPQEDPSNPGNFTATNNLSEFNSDFDGDISNGEYNNRRLAPSDSYWNYYLLSHDPNSQDYSLPDPEGITYEEKANGVLRDLFSSVQDPVYAFKYFEYTNGTYPVLEGQTCYRDPNMCTDEFGNEVPCLGLDNNGDPLPVNFCGIGYISCPYTKDEWSCGQRYTFFEMIKNYTESAQYDGAPVDCDNYYEATSFVVNPDFQKIYQDDGSNANEFVLQYLAGSNIRPDVFTDLPYLSENLVQQYITSPSWESLVNNYGQPSLTDIEGNESTSGISIIENDAYQMAQECEGGCDERRNEFKEKLIEAFTDRCYVIGECKVDSNDNVVPMEDIDALVDKIVEQCKNQCAITTYACVDEPCRSIGNTNAIASTSDAFDFNVSYIDFGVSGPIVSGVSAKEAQLLVIFDPQTGSYVTKSEAPVVETATNSAGVFEKYSYPKNIPSVWDIRKSLTYAEYSRYIQAMDWYINIDLPSKCDQNGAYNANLTYDSNGLPLETVYVKNLDSGIWEPQNFDICNTPYVTRQNPNGPGDTFVDREDYVKNTSTPPSSDDESLTTPVQSPKTGIHYSTNNQ